MLVLAFDTSLNGCSVAVHDSEANADLAGVSRPMARGQAERLSAMIAEAMKQANSVFGDIDRIAVTVGPGTFTGVRIGVAMARGMALALDRLVLGVGTLPAIVRNITDNPDRLPIAAVVDARRGEVYVQTFSAGFRPLSEAAALPLEEAAHVLPHGPVLLVGSGGPALAALHGKAIPALVPDLPNARAIARIAAGAEPAGAPRPLYLRAADAKPQKPLTRLSPARVDIARAGALQAELLAAMHRNCFKESWATEKFAALLATPGALALTASHRGQPVGMIVVRRAADASRKADIISLCTRPGSRRRAVASQLLASTIERLKAANAVTLSLEVAADNIPAVAFYAKHGFRQCARRRGYYRADDGSRHDGLVMTRRV